jgi:hypothetical protein
MKKQSPALLAKRTASLLPDGIPKYVRCYDQGEDGTCDRYTVCFTGLAPVLRGEHGAADYPYLGMSANPFHPQGFGQHGWSKEHPCDVINGWPPAMGRKHPNLGKRIPFAELPKDCQSLVLQDYKDFWELWDNN